MGTNCADLMTLIFLKINLHENCVLHQIFNQLMSMHFTIFDID